VIIDMPTTLVQWTEVVLGMSQVYFGMLELDLRSAQNALRLIRALKAEDLPHEKIRYALNRARPEPASARWRQASPAILRPRATDL